MLGETFVQLTWVGIFESTNLSLELEVKALLIAENQLPFFPISLSLVAEPQRCLKCMRQVSFQMV